LPPRYGAAPTHRSRSSLITSWMAWRVELAPSGPMQRYPGPDSESNAVGARRPPHRRCSGPSEMGSPDAAVPGPPRNLPPKRRNGSEEAAGNERPSTHRFSRDNSPTMDGVATFPSAQKRADSTSAQDGKWRCEAYRLTTPGLRCAKFPERVARSGIGSRPFVSVRPDAAGHRAGSDAQQCRTVGDQGRSYVR